MSIFSAIEHTVLPFIVRVQKAIGDVIFDYTGVITSDIINQVIFYFVGTILLYLVWLLVKPAESVYHYRSQHHH